MRHPGLAAAILGAFLVAGCASSGTQQAPAPAPVAPKVDPEAEARWQAMKKQEQRFYMLDQQKFTSISCKVDAQLLDNLMQVMHASLAPLGDKVKVTDTLADYRLTYSSGTGLHMDDPTLQITSKPGITLPDPARFDDGVKKLTTAFASMVSGLDTELAAVFSIMQSSRQGDYDVLYVNETADGFSASMMDKKSGGPLTIALAGHTLTTKGSSGVGASMNAVSEYDPLPSGKLLLREITVDIDQSSTTIHAQSVPTYQRLGDVTFPSHLSVKGSITALQATHQDIDMEMDISGCTVR